METQRGRIEGQARSSARGAGERAKERQQDGTSLTNRPAAGATGLRAPARSRVHPWYGSICSRQTHGILRPLGHRVGWRPRATLGVR